MESRKHLIKYTLPFTFLLLLIFALILIKSRTDKPYYKNIEKGFTKIIFETDYLPQIDTGHYVLWGINDGGEKIIIKRFNYYNGELISLNYEKLEYINIEGDYNFSEYEITVEKVGDRDEVQSGCILLKGENKGGKIDFSLAPFDLGSINGSFLLATFSDDNTDINEKSGIWFINEVNNPRPSLDLPELPSCWTYAAYLKYREHYLRIGDFKINNDKDTFAGYSQTYDAPIDFPGEDFLRGLPEGITAPINVVIKDNSIAVGLEPDNSLFRLKTNYEPFWPLLSYNFDGEENTHTSLELNPAEQPQIKIEIQKN